MRCLAAIHESANNLRSVIYTFVSGPDTISNGLSTIIGNTLHVARQKECLTGQRASLWPSCILNKSMWSMQLNNILNMHDLTEHFVMCVSFLTHASFDQ